MNIGVKEAMKLDQFDCFIFHDVDLIPENDLNAYECGEQPRHLSPAVDELRYKYASSWLFALASDVQLLTISPVTT